MNGWPNFFNGELNVKYSLIEDKWGCDFFDYRVQWGSLKSKKRIVSLWNMFDKDRKWDYPINLLRRVDSDSYELIMGTYNLDVMKEVVKWIFENRKKDLKKAVLQKFKSAPF